MPRPKLQHLKTCLCRHRSVSNAEEHYEAYARTAGNAIEDEEPLATRDTERSWVDAPDSHPTSSTRLAKILQRQLEAEDQI
jgi:hypothetical protein